MVQWHCIEKEEVIERLHSSSSQGITEEQARKRREKYGKNRLASPKRKGILYRFLQQFQDFMVLVLLAAAAVSFVTSRLKGDSDYIDSIIILAIVLVNAITGMIQESRAEKASRTKAMTNSGPQKIPGEGPWPVQRSKSDLSKGWSQRLERKAEQAENNTKRGSCDV